MQLSGEPIRLLLVDDSDVIRHVIRNFLVTDRTIEIVGEARNLAEMLKMSVELKPNVVLMDLHMKDENQFEPNLVKYQLLGSSDCILAMFPSKRRSDC